MTLRCMSNLCYVYIFFFFFNHLLTVIHLLSSQKSHSHSCVVSNPVTTGCGRSNQLCCNIAREPGKMCWLQGQALLCSISGPTRHIEQSFYRFTLVADWCGEPGLGGWRRMVSDVPAVKGDACPLATSRPYCKCWQSLGSVRLEGELPFVLHHKEITSEE